MFWFDEQLKQQWGEKYAEWMAQTEQKLQDLQQANDLMLERAQALLNLYLLHLSFKLCMVCLV